MKNEYFKKPRQTLAIVKANPYLPHTCGTFTQTPLMSPSSAPLEMLPSNKPRSPTDKDTVMGSKIHTGTGTTGTQRSPRNDNNNVQRGSGRRADQLTNFTHWFLSLRSLIPQQEGVGEEEYPHWLPVRSDPFAFFCKLSSYGSSHLLHLGLSLVLVPGSAAVPASLALCLSGGRASADTQSNALEAGRHE